MPQVGPSADVQTARQRIVSDILRIQALRNPTKVALVNEGQRDSFAELDLVVSRTANSIRELGVVPGDRVALLSHNNRSFVVFRFAIIRAGAVVVPINFMLNAREIAYIVDHAGCSMVIAEDALCATVDEAIEQSPARIRSKVFLRHDDVAAPAGWLDGDALLDHPSDAPPQTSAGEDDAVQIMYTSGTESRPKGVLLTTRSLMTQYVSCIVDGGMDADDVELHCLPLYHCAQLDVFLSVDLYLGATSILLRAPNPALMLAAIEQHRITKLFCPPTVWISLLRHPDFDRRDLGSLRKGYYGASVMPTVIVEELLQRLPDMRLWNLYGQTEMSPLATALQPEQQLAKLGSAGKPVLNVETRVVDDSGASVPSGVVGEIVHRSPQAMLGYLNDEAKTAEAFRDGWFHSGDLGLIDEDGFLYVVDRKKDMIKTGGENVASKEVEEALFRHPAVAEVAVIGLPDPRWIEAVTAVIVTRDGSEVSSEELDAYCRQKLAPYKRPKSYVFMPYLPKNASGKVLKRSLRDHLTDQLAASEPCGSGPS